MSLAMDICDYVYVMDFGRLIFEGIPVDVQASPEVQAAYLGDEEVPAAASRLTAGEVQ